MKFRRFTPAGIAAARDYLAKAKAAAALDLPARDALIASPALTESIPALADLDFDPTRTFDTTFAFCEYLDSLLAPRNPQSYREDVGFWTYLAFAYLEQLAYGKSLKVRIGEESRFVYSVKYTEIHRHLLASPFYIYELYRDAPENCKCVLWNKLWAHGEIQEQIAARQPIVQNSAFMRAVYLLYFDQEKNIVKKGGGGSGPGSPRRFVDAVDQFGLTRDFFREEDASEFLKILPAEFNRFNPLRV